MTFSNILPDPVNKITNAGVYDNTTGSQGPGFASISLRSVRDTQVSRTVSGRGVTRSSGGQYWEMDINYHPMTRAQFEPVYSFLLSRNGRKDPFYIALPEYAAPRSPAFAACVTTTPIYVDLDTLAGSSSITIRHPSIAGDPSPGDLFNIQDSNNVNHTKAYRVTRVENSIIYETAGLEATQRRIWFTPELSKTTYKGLTAITSTGVASNVFTKASHGMSPGQQVRLQSGGSGLVVNTVYYVVYLTSNTFSLSATLGGAALAVTSNVTVIPSPTLVVFSNPKFRCILKNDVQEYNLGTNNLFNFSLSVEEIQP
jgi:hypothetical protein